MDDRTTLAAVNDADPGAPDAFRAMLELDHPVKRLARDWASENLPAASDLKGSVVDRDTWRRVGDAGLLGMQLPAEHGGSPRSATDIALTLEGLGNSTADSGVVFAIASQAVTSSRAIAASGSPEQLARWAPGLAAGDAFAAFAMSEAQAGSNPWEMSTTATARDDGSWILNGTKTWATLGPICDVALVFAASDPDKGQWGISAFLVPADTPGFVRGQPIPKMGMQSCPFGELHFDDCHVPADALLGRVGAGAAIFTSVVEAERAFLYATQLGMAERMLDLAVSFARTRQQGGVHVGSHQAVAHRIVDMKVHHEAARLLLYKAMARHDRGESFALEAALAKIMTAELAVNASIDALRTFGASGYITSTGIEVEIRNALAGLSYSGTPDITRNIVASGLGLSRPA